MLQRVHDYVTSQRGPEKVAEIIAVRPLRRWVNGAHPPVIFQDGKFYSDGGQEMRLDDVPSYIRDEVEKTPVRATGERVEAVVRFCPICERAGKDVAIPSDQMEAHLIEHINGALAAKEAEAKAEAELLPATRD